VKITAQVTDADGKPLVSARVDVVADGQVLSSGIVKDGALVVSVLNPLPPVWGLAIDGQPILAFPVTAVESVDMGEIVLIPQGLALPAFHAPEGRVYGAPTATFRAVTATAAPTRRMVAPELASTNTFAPVTSAPPVTSALPVAPATPGPVLGQPVGPAVTPALIDFLTPVPLKVLFDSTAQQLANVLDNSQRVKFTGATVTVRGLPAGSGSDLSLQFPSADLAKNASGLSELSFALRPDVAGTVTTKPPPASPLPDLSGYTRDLAIRKLGSVGLSADVASEVVADPHAVGRVVRQVPKAGAPADPDALVQLFIGKAGGAP
jgi:PASTA domain